MFFMLRIQELAMVFNDYASWFIAHALAINLPISIVIQHNCIRRDLKCLISLYYNEIL
jgi:hypothetical protein